MKALFVCDEKEEWNLLRNIFHAHFSKIDLICVLKSEDALETLTFDGPFGMVIIDCALKNSHPTELAKQIFEQAGPRPILFVGTATMIKDRVDQGFFDQHDMLAVYQKPFNPDTLIEAIDDAINWTKQEDYENSIVELNPENFLPMKLRNFYLYDQVPFDVYVELTKTKFIKAISANKKYTQSTIQDFQKRTIKYLYLEKNEHLNFLENSLKKISQTLNAGTPDPKKEIQTMIAGVLVVHQYLRDVGISQSLVTLVDQIIKKFSKVSESYSSLLDLLLSFPFEHGDIAEQAILKGLVSEVIGNKMGWRSGLSRSKLGLAAIIHDSFLEREEWSTISYQDHPDLDHLNKEKKLNFLNHPKRAAEIAQQFIHYPEADFIITEHHELPDGNGFPQGLNAGKVTKISAVFILSSNFVIQLVINGIKKSSIKSILSGFQTIYSVGNFKEPFQILQREFKKK